MNNWQKRNNQSENNNTKTIRECFYPSRSNVIRSILARKTSDISWEELNVIYVCDKDFRTLHIMTTINL